MVLENRVRRFSSYFGNLVVGIPIMARSTLLLGLRAFAERAYRHESVDLPSELPLSFTTDGKLGLRSVPLCARAHSYVHYSINGGMHTHSPNYVFSWFRHFVVTSKSLVIKVVSLCAVDNADCMSQT